VSAGDRAVETARGGVTTGVYAHSLLSVGVAGRQPPGGLARRVVPRSHGRSGSPRREV